MDWSRRIDSKRNLGIQVCSDDNETEEETKQQRGRIEPRTEQNKRLAQVFVLAQRLSTVSMT